MSVIKVRVGKQGQRGLSGVAAPETIAVNNALSSVVTVATNIGALNTIVANIVDLQAVANSLVAITRSFPVNVVDFGAIGDGLTHPLSNYYTTLANAQVDYPQATALTDELDGTALRKCIAYCVANNRNTIYTPTPTVTTGYYRFNTFIDFPYTLSSREGYINFIGDIGSAEKRYTATWVRTTSAAGFRFIGTSLSVNSSNHLIAKVNMKNICLNGGWANPSFNTSADYPVLYADSGYEFDWDDAYITQSLGGVHLREVMDSRFNNIRITWSGQHNGYLKDMTMTNGSATVTVTSTTGLYKGQRVYGTGVQTVRISSITDSTTLVLSANMNYTGTRKAGFEVKPALLIDSNNITNATANNQVWDGYRIENCAGVGIRIQGQNIIDIFANSGKIENNTYQLDYLIEVENANGVFFDKQWLYAAPTTYDKMKWSVTTAGKTLATALSNSIDSFTLNTYTADTGTFTTGSKIVTGLASTTNLYVGQNVNGTGITSSSLQGVCIASIDSGTQITMTDNAVSTGALAISFSYPFNHGVFYRRGFFTCMPILAWDATDPRNYMLCRTVNYNSTTGILDLHVLNVFGDTSKSITSWVVAPCHIGLAHFGNVNTCKGLFEGGYPTGGTAGSTIPYLHSYIHIENSNGYIGEAIMNSGMDLLPKNTFQAQISTSSVTVGTGSKTFTIATGLPADMFVKYETVYINGGTSGTIDDQMVGLVDSYNSGTGDLVVNVISSKGSGTNTNWKISFGKQPLHLQTGTNYNISTVELTPEYGRPANVLPINPINTDFKDTTNEFTKQQYVRAKSLIDGATINWNLDDAPITNVTLAGNRTLANPTNMKAGALYTIMFIQDATGSRTITFDTAYVGGSTALPTLTTAANKKDLLQFYCDGAKMYLTNVNLNLT